jgi:hypothetical protein
MEALSNTGCGIDEPISTLDQKNETEYQKKVMIGNKAEHFLSP